jgi:hypothetical protein
MVRTAELIRSYGPTIERVEKNMAEDRLTSDDALVLAQIVSDAQILVGLIEQLAQRGVDFD